MMETASPSRENEAKIIGMDLARGSSGEGPIKRVAKLANREPDNMTKAQDAGQRSMKMPQRGALKR